MHTVKEKIDELEKTQNNDQDRPILFYKQVTTHLRYLTYPDNNDINLKINNKIFEKSPNI